MPLDPSSLAHGALDTMATLFGDLPVIARRMADEQTAAARFKADPMASWWVLPRLQGRFRYRLMNQTLTPKDGTQPIYDIEVQVAAGLADDPASEPKAAPVTMEQLGSKVPFRVQVPRMLQVGPGDRVTLDLRSSGSGRIVFDGISDDVDRVRMSYDGKPVTSPTWPVEPVLAFAREVRRWIADPPGQSQELIGILPGLDDPVELRQVLAVLVDGWLGIEQALFKSAQGQPVSLDPRLSARFELEEYRATVDLRLDAKGRIAPKESGVTVQVQMELEVVRDGDAWVARAGCRPPDFLLAGDLANAIRVEFGKNKKLKQDLSRALARLGTSVSDDHLTRFIVEEPEASVLRVGRDKHRHRELLIIEGPLNGRSMVMMAVGEVEFEPGNPPQVKPSKDIHLLYPDPDSGPTTGLDRRDQQWLLHLIQATKLWAGFGFLNATPPNTPSAP
jgi:hypothetical protein